MLVQKVEDCKFDSASNELINQNHSYKLKYSTQYGTIIDTENITILDLAIPSTDERIIVQGTVVDTQVHNQSIHPKNNITHTYSTQNYSFTDIDTQGRFAVFSCDHDLCFAILDMKTGLFFKDIAPTTSDEISIESAFTLDIETDTLHYLHTKIAPPKHMSIDLHKILLENSIMHLCQL